MSRTFLEFLRSYEEQAIPLNREANQSYWAAATLGRLEDQERAARAVAALRKVLAEEADGSRRRAAWEASKSVGVEVAPKLLALAEERNRVARDLGFRDYFALRLTIDELNEGELFAVLEDLERRTENGRPRRGPAGGCTGAGQCAA